jgi:hydrogenase maturation protease
MRVRVIGIGSGFGDDAAGLAVVDLLARGDVPAEISIARCERPLPDLLDALDDVDGVVLVDASRSGAALGSVRRLRAAELARSQATSSHGLGVAAVLSLARELGRAPARVEWVAIEGGPAAPGAPASAAVARAVPAAAALALDVAREIADLQPGS